MRLHCAQWPTFSIDLSCRERYLEIFPLGNAVTKRGKKTQNLAKYRKKHKLVLISLDAAGRKIGWLTRKEATRAQRRLETQAKKIQRA